MDWFDLSLEMRRSAKILLDEGMWRSSVNRSYYSLYAAATGAILQGGERSFGGARFNPGHKELPTLILVEGRLKKDVRRRVQKSLRLLRNAREDADYRPGRGWFNESQARMYFREATTAIRDLGVKTQ